MRSRPARRGFTLIELMIALAALAVLAVVALPTFFEGIARARRTEMQAALLDDAGYMQHYYASHDAFTGTPPPRLPSARTPRTGAANYLITLSVPSADATSFVLTAQRTGAMASDPCGDFTYDSLGRRDLAAGTATRGRDADSCWR
jgi:type IV pilus assembly protein PilE